MPAVPFMPEAEARSMILTDVRNTVCPVTGEKIAKPRFNTTYNGKRYWFATVAAMETFKGSSNKEMYIRKLGSLTAAPARAGVSSYTAPAMNDSGKRSTAKGLTKY